MSRATIKYITYKYVKETTHHVISGVQDKDVRVANSEWNAAVRANSFSSINVYVRHYSNFLRSILRR